ncbi:DUF2087 domain-containing protein [Nocardioides sp. W3-2-3]|uniref:DUF2087 domain-containing protein n=1 Tax=Nocardioides convexus TaxID=2712224 RepID=UPI002418965D|nr:DUF2087 domain-containing protein [Nocardioides convexus]NHA01596.1 DUF2087 domain-containing protein [Nocardioides convexus]
MSDEEQTLRRFFTPEGRLRDLPTRHLKRRVVLDRIAQRFEPGRRYDWREVDAILKEIHPDHAALRRYLVDDGFLTRQDDVYWRSGGTFEV